MILLRSAFLSLLFVALLLTGCDDGGSAENSAPAGSTVKILSTSPVHSESLNRGDLVRLRVEVEYRLNADSGTLSLVVQESDTSSISVQTEVVARGTGTSVFETEFVVPDTKAILLFTPLTGQGQTKTSTVDTLAFKVEADDSEELNLEEATLIDADYCAVTGITVGSSYDDVVSVFGHPEEVTEIGAESGGSAPIGQSLDYEGIFVGLKNDSVIIVSTESAEHGLQGGIRPSSSRDDVARAFGDTVGMTGQGREVLAYRCRDFRTPSGHVMMAVLVVDGLVESISVVEDDEE
jgi:hypothetical protein